MPNRNISDTTETNNRGFASMPPDKIEEAARKGGQGSAQKTGHEGMAERGRKGGESRGNKQSKEEEE